MGSVCPGDIRQQDVVGIDLQNGAEGQQGLHGQAGLAALDLAEKLHADVRPGGYIFLRISLGFARRLDAFADQLHIILQNTTSHI